MPAAAFGPLPSGVRHQVGRTELVHAEDDFGFAVLGYDLAVGDCAKVLDAGLFGRAVGVEWHDQPLTAALTRPWAQGQTAAAIHTSPPQGCARQAITTPGNAAASPRKSPRSPGLGREAGPSGRLPDRGARLSFVAASPAPPYEGGQLPRSTCAHAQLFPQGLCRRGSVVHLPMPGVKHPGPHQQRIRAPLPPLALRTSAALSLLVHRVIQPINRPVHQKLHRQQQRGRRPPSDEHRLPLQSRGRRDVRSQRDRDPQRKGRPHGTSRAGERTRHTRRPRQQPVRTEAESTRRAQGPGCRRPPPAATG